MVETRSRVTPAVGSTMAMRRPASQLNSEDLPTLGRPTMATTGRDTATPPAGGAVWATAGYCTRGEMMRGGTRVSGVADEARTHFAGATTGRYKEKRKPPSGVGASGREA